MNSNGRTLIGFNLVLVKTILSRRFQRFASTVPQTLTLASTSVYNNFCEMIVYYNFHSEVEV